MITIIQKKKKNSHTSLHAIFISKNPQTLQIYPNWTNEISPRCKDRSISLLAYLHHQRDRHQPLTLVLRLAHIVIQFRVVPVHLYLEQRETRGTWGNRRSGFIFLIDNNRDFPPYFPLLAFGSQLPPTNFSGNREEGGGGRERDRGRFVARGYTRTEPSSCPKLQRSPPFGSSFSFASPRTN